MAKKCAITGKTAGGKGRRYSFLRSHFNPTSKRKFEVNLQKVTVVIDGVKQTIRVSANALKTFPKLKSGITSAELKAGRSKLRKSSK